MRRDAVAEPVELCGDDSARRNPENDCQNADQALDGSESGEPFCVEGRERNLNRRKKLRGEEREPKKKRRKLPCSSLVF